MRRRGKVVLFSLLAALVGGAMLFGSIAWFLWQESVAAERAYNVGLANSLGEHTEEIFLDTRDLLDHGDQAGATARVTDLETAWDDAQAKLKPRDSAAWTAIDGKIDTVLRELRSTSPDPASEKVALDTLLAALR